MPGGQRLPTLEQATHTQAEVVINEVYFQLAAAIEVGFHWNVLGAQFAKGKPFVVDAVAQSHHGLGRKPGVLVFKGSVGRTCDFNVRV